jgi:uncharacterized protein (TIGR02145 family)
MNIKMKQLLCTLFCILVYIELFAQEGVTKNGQSTTSSSGFVNLNGQIGSNTTLDKNGQMLTVTDIDGNLYYIVAIGTQLWMKENLKTTKYNDGSAIPLNTTWVNPTTPAYCWYNNDATTYKAIYGALYNWYTVNTGNVCPTGWRVPTDAAFTVLTTYLGGSTVAGGKLKEAGTVHWLSPNTAATNVTGFTAVGGGHRLTNGSFAVINQNNDLWSSNQADASNGINRYMLYNDAGVTSYNSGKGLGFSVRCIKISVPSVTTTALTNITTNSALSGGNITDDGGANVTTRGVCWSTHPNPTIMDNITSNGTGVGVFIGSITGLTSGTTYYLKAYSTNNIGTAYGNQLSFNTL